MKKGMIYILVVSAAFNFAVLGALGYRMWEKHKQQKEIEHKIVICSPDEKNMIWVELEPGQKERLHHQRLHFQPKVGSIREELHDARNHLSQLLMADTTDTIQINIQIEKIGALQTKMEKEVVHQLLKERSELDPEQRRLFLDMVVEHLRGSPDCHTKPHRIIEKRVITTNGKMKKDIKIETSYKEESR